VTTPTLAASGFRLPAEWEPHDATWLAWPHKASDWPGKLPTIPWVYGEIVRALAPGEIARILVASPEERRRAARLLDRVGVPPERVEFLPIRTDRSWIRDYGPCFVRRDGDGARAVVRFRFTAWAKYPDWHRDDRVAERAARRLGLDLVPAEAGGHPLVLEGGSIDGNGRGTLLTTEECLLDAEVQVRNPGVSRNDLETALSATLGARHIVWLGRGIAGDDTHGHVDDVCRFVGPRTVVLCEEPDGADPNHRVLEENRERLESARLEDGSAFEVLRLPMPAPLSFDGQRLPASYANFYVGNAAVLVPTFNDPQDRLALGLLGEVFERPVVGIHAVDLVWGLGTIHCLSHEEPARATPPTSR
jgi:agmatine deiminase